MRPIIVFLDNDPESVKDIIDDFNGRETVSRPRKAIAKEFDLRAVVVSSAGDAKHIASAARAEIRRLRPNAILVDLNFIETTSTSTTTWKRGAEVAVELRKHFALVPIGVYSQFQIEPEDRIRLSGYRFDVVLEPLTQLMRVQRTSFPNSAWLEVFQKLTYASHSAEFPAIFISHAHKDRALVEAVTDLFLKALPLEARDIVASSVGGSELPTGISLHAELVARVQNAECVVVLLTKESVKSRYVWYETGLARATAGKPIIPLVARVTSEVVRDTPFGDVLALRCDNRTDLLKLITTIARVVGMEQTPPEEWERLIKRVLELTGGSSV